MSKINPIPPEITALIDQDIAGVEDNIKNEIVPNVIQSLTSVDRAFVIDLMANVAVTLAMTSPDNLRKLSASWAVAVTLLAEAYNENSDSQ